MIITTGPNGEFARHHSMVILAQIQLDLEIVNTHVTGNVKKYSFWKHKLETIQLGNIN